MDRLPPLGLAVVVLTVVGYGLNRASRWAGARGWISTKHHPRPRGSGTLGILDQIYQPSMEHVIEERASEAIRASEDESAEPPHAGSTPPEE